MGTSITSGRWKVNTETRRLYRDTSVSPTITDTVLTLYSDLQDLFDQPDYMDDTVPMTAQTPTEFTVGGTDSDFPWFMAPPDAKYLRGGAIQTAGWSRTVASENGIVMVTYNGSTDPVAADLDATITDVTNSDSGTLLGFDTTDGKLWIRPADDTAANNFDTGSGNLNGGTTSGIGAQTAAGIEGEYLWANPNSVGVFSTQTGTRGYVYQDGAKVTNWPAGIGLNADGEFDILLLVREADIEIDNAQAVFFARRGGALGDWFESDFTNGGRVTIPLTGNPDTVNDSVGHHNVTWTGGSGATLLVGEIVDLNSDSEVAAVVANVTTPSAATGDFDYFLIRGLTQFSNTDAVTAVTSGKTMTLGTPTDLTPVTDTDITFTHGAFTRDINNGSGARPYSIDVDPNSKSWERVYRRGKYITRRGSTTQIDNINGEYYRGSTLQLEYENEAGTFTEGLTVTGQTSGATGVIVALHDDGTTGDLILRNVRGTFSAGEQILDTSTGDGDILAAAGIRVIPTLKFAPLGNLAGTLWQGAPGMAPILANVASGREQDYSLIDDNGVVQNPPNTVSVTVTSLGIDDWVSVFRLDAPFSSGGQIDKDDYGSHASNNVTGDITFDVDASISQEAPPAGWIRVVDTSVTPDLEHRYKYASFSGTTFTFKTDADWHIAGSTITGASADGLTLTDSTAAFITSGVEPGMMVRNVTDGSYGFVASVNSETELSLEPINTTSGFEGNGLTGGTENDFDASDDYRINELVQGYDATDNVYVPFLDQKNTAGTTETTTIIQSTDIDVLVRVRNGGIIQPFQAGQTIGANGMTQAAIRTLDTIAT